MGRKTVVPRVVVDWAAYEAKVVAEMLGLGMPDEVARAEAKRTVERGRLRHEWGRERLDAFFAMQDLAGEVYQRQIEENPDVDWEDVEPGEFPDPPEEAVAQAIYAEVMDALERDRWPRHLHFHRV
jgi:hypothetical protein